MNDKRIKGGMVKKLQQNESYIKITDHNYHKVAKIKNINASVLEWGREVLNFFVGICSFKLAEVVFQL